MNGGREARMWPGVTVAVVLALLAFIISFDALRAVGLACGINASLAWMFPIIIDGSTLAFTWAAWAFKTRRMGTLYPWLMLVLFSVISLIGNALHAHPVMVNGMLLPDWVPPVIMTVPPVALLATTHMIVLAAGRTFDRQAMAEAVSPEPAGPSAAPTPEPTPGIAPEPDASTPDDPASVIGTDHDTEPGSVPPGPADGEPLGRRWAQALGDAGDSLADRMLAAHDARP